MPEIQPFSASNCEKKNGISPRSAPKNCLNRQQSLCFGRKSTKRHASDAALVGLGRIPLADASFPEANLRRL